MKTSCPPAENISETSDYQNSVKHISGENRDTNQLRNISKLILQNVEQSDL